MSRHIFLAFLFKRPKKTRKGILWSCSVSKRQIIIQLKKHFFSNFHSIFFSHSKEPVTKFERIQKTVLIAKERARKTSVSIIGGGGASGGSLGPATSGAALRRESRKEDSIVLPIGSSAAGGAAGGGGSMSSGGSVVSGGGASGSNAAAEGAGGGTDISEVERSIKARMQKRDGIMR